MIKAVQAKHIPDELMLEHIRRRPIESPYPWVKDTWTTTRDLEEELPEFPLKVILAKCRALIRRGLITGCACGCYGGFERVPELEL